MSNDQYRAQLERKREQRIYAEKQAGENRAKESKKRAESARARLEASKTKSESTAKSKLRVAERKDKEAEMAGKEAGRWQSRSVGYAHTELALITKLERAQKSQADVLERRRQRDQQQADRRIAASRTALESRISGTESVVNRVLLQVSAPKPENLRILMLGASSEGDLRVGREQKRIRAAVESALHRDQVELDLRPAATTSDLLDGITKFRPHVVHFSGHSYDDLIVFEDEQDSRHSGVIVTVRAFANAMLATDDPPLLVLLNACKSASQIQELVEQVVPFAIGMADSIDDGDAINYAAQFYAAIANGQSVSAAHRAGLARLELDGLDSVEMPILAWASGADPNGTILVKPYHRA